MQLRGLDLNLLIALDALLEEGSVSRAAERIHISQSGMSAALARLRAFFSDPLLEPVGRVMRPTALAVTLAAPVRDLILQAQMITDLTPSFDPATATRSFSIVASDYIATVFLPRLLRRLARVAPDVAVNILQLEETPAGVMERGDADLLIIPEQFAAEEHPRTRLFAERYVCVSWSECEAPADLDGYLGRGHVVARPGSMRMLGFDELFVSRFDQPRRVEITVPAYSLMPRYLVGTRRMATMFERLAQEFAGHLPLRIDALPFDMPDIVEALQWHRVRDLDPALMWLRTVIVEEASVMRRGSTVGDETHDHKGFCERGHA